MLLRFQRFINHSYRLQAPAGDEGAPPAPTIESVQAENKKLADELAALKAAKPPAPPAPAEDPSLEDKVRKEREEKERQASQTKNMESAIRFNLTAKSFLTDNEKLLPKSVAGLVETADKEIYGSEHEKANAIKVVLVKEFFALQENLDLLTDGQKNELAEFKKLTNNDRHDRVAGIYAALFEPTFEQKRRLEKAKFVEGSADPSNAEKAYEQKMIELSKSKYLKGSK